MMVVQKGRALMVLTLTVPDAEYMIEVFEERLMQHSDGFDMEILAALKPWTEEYRKDLRRAEINEQIAELERERDSI